MGAQPQAVRPASTRARTRSALLVVALLLAGITLAPTAAAADVTVEGSAHTDLDLAHGAWGPIWTSTRNGYIVYLNAAEDVVYRKTTDGGNTWGSAVAISALTTEKLSVWYDGWTTGDTGTTIHISYMDSAGGNPDQVYYRSLDTSTDTLGTEQTIFAPSAIATQDDRTELTITKARGGNLYAGFFYDNTGATHDFYRSTDGGATWTDRTTMGDTSMAWMRAFPGNEADTNDVWIVYWDWASDQLELKVYDDSANSWSTTTIGTGMVETTLVTQFSGVQRQSDNHVVLTAWNSLIAGGADLKVWDIAGSASIVAKTDAVTDTTTDLGAAAFIDQRTNDLYLTYLTFATTLSVNYKKSTDGGTTWGAVTNLNENADATNVWVEAGHSVGANGGRFRPLWFDTTAITGDDILVPSTASSVYLGPAVTLSLSGSPQSENGGVATVTATIPAAASLDTTVTLGYSGTAASGTDYSASSSTIVISAGATTGTATITGIDDNIDGPSLTAIVDITGVTNGYEATAQQVTSTITDDDPLPAATVDDASAAEGDAVGFTITLANPSANQIDIDYTTSSGTATEGTDFPDASGQVTFAPGETSKPISVPTTEDTMDEPSEVFTVTISLAAGETDASIGDASGSGTITDDDAAPTASIDDASAAEGDAVGFTITLSNPSSSRIDIDYTTTGGTATEGTDFPDATTTVSFAPGETSKPVSVPTTEDTTDEPDEGFTITISLATGETDASIGDATGDATITDDDAAPTAGIDDASASEGDEVGFTITLSNPSVSQIDIDYTTTGGTATEGTDYPDATSTVSFAPGETTKPVSVPTTEDTTDEPDEGFAVTISLASGETDATIADATGAGTITDDDATPAAAIDDASASEGDAVGFTITLSNPSVNQIDIDYTTSSGTATEGSDFADQTGSVSFAPGETTKPVSVATNEDTTDEPDEGFTVTISLASGETDATIGDATGAGTITDDDNTPAASIDDASAAEGDAAGFTITLSNPSSSQIDIDYTTTSGSATEGTDFPDATSTLSFAPGETSKPVSVPTTEDTMDEPDEGFTVTISLATGETDASITDATGAGTITDDDAAPTASIDDDSAAEGDAAGFTITLSNPSSSQIDIDYTTSSGTATEDTDFPDATGSVTFAPGETSKPVPVPTSEDTTDEPDEGFTVTISLAAGETDASISDATGAGTITDDDAAPSATIDDVAASEGDALGFTITLSNPSVSPIDIDYTTSSGTAIEGTDFPDATGTVTFAPGETTKPAAVPTTEDLIDEPDEGFTITIGLASGETDGTIADATGAGTINDDDGVPSASINDASAAEGDAVGFTVTLSNPSSTQIDIDYTTTSGTAVEGTDFTDTTGQVNFAPGETTKPVSVPTTENGLIEATKEFTITISLASGESDATIGDATGTGAITDDDALPTASINDASAAEGDPVGFTITLSGPSAAQIDLDYTTASGTATEGTDFPDTSGTVTFSPGTTSAIVTVPTTEDALDEPAEGFTVTIVLDEETDATILDSVGAGTITDDDPAPSGGGGGSAPPIWSVTQLHATPNPISLPVLDQVSVTVSATTPSGQSVSLAYDSCAWDAASSGGALAQPATNSCTVTFVAGSVPGDAYHLDVTFTRWDATVLKTQIPVTILPVPAAPTTPAPGSDVIVQCTAALPTTTAFRTMPVTMPECSLPSIVLAWPEDVLGGELDVLVLPGLPAGIPPVPGATQTVLVLDIQFSGSPPTSTTIRFTIPDVDCVAPCTVTLFHFHDGQWLPLETKQVGAGEFILYEAHTLAFSIFAAVIPNAGAPEAPDLPPEPEGPTPPAARPSKWIPMFGILAVLLIIAAFVAIAGRSGLRAAMAWVGRKGNEPSSSEPDSGSTPTSAEHADRLNEDVDARAPEASEHDTSDEPAGHKE